MSRYIDKDTLGLTDFEIFMCDGSYKEALKMLLEKIEQAPTADVRENVKGEWIKEVDTMGGYDDYTPINYYCSICGYLSMDGQTNYCPNCGSDMRGEV